MRWILICLVPHGIQKPLRILNAQAHRHSRNERDGMAQDPFAQRRRYRTFKILKIEQPSVPTTRTTQNAVVDTFSRLALSPARQTVPRCCTAQRFPHTIVKGIERGTGWHTIGRDREMCEINKFLKFTRFSSCFLPANPQLFGVDRIAAPSSRFHPFFRKPLFSLWFTLFFLRSLDFGVPYSILILLLLASPIRNPLRFWRLANPRSSAFYLAPSRGMISWPFLTIFPQ